MLVSAPSVQICDSTEQPLVKESLWTWHSCGKSNYLITRAVGTVWSTKMDFPTAQLVFLFGQSSDCASQTTKTNQHEQLNSVSQRVVLSQAFA